MATEIIPPPACPIPLLILPTHTVLTGSKYARLCCVWVLPGAQVKINEPHRRIAPGEILNFSFQRLRAWSRLQTRTGSHFPVDREICGNFRNPTFVVPHPSARSETPNPEHESETNRSESKSAPVCCCVYYCGAGCRKQGLELFLFGWSHLVVAYFPPSSR